MVSGIQAAVMIFAVVMVFITYNYYRRNHLDKKDLVLWTAAWAVLFLAGLFPQSISFLVQSLHIERGMDFFTIAGFIFLLLVVFYLYSIVFRMQKKIERIVLAVAGKKAYRKR